ncbi:MAG: hypothetical protein IJS14_00875 [Lentisphaeria bacterium]|nr:hypothetical protein [Lentisphaeria bacterium]
MEMNVVMIQIEPGKGVWNTKSFTIEEKDSPDGRDAVKKAATQCGIPGNILENRRWPLMLLDEDACLHGWTDEIEYAGIRYKFLIEHDFSIQIFNPDDDGTITW